MQKFNYVLLYRGFFIFFGLQHAGRSSPQRELRNATKPHKGLGDLTLILINMNCRLSIKTDRYKNIMHLEVPLSTLYWNISGLKLCYAEH